LPSTGCPAEVSRWIGGNRTKVPEVRSVNAYTRAWWRWWGSMQSEWCVCMVDGKWEVQAQYGEWEDELLVWGKNGHLVLIASLYFWGRAVLESPTLHLDWEAAVLDVTWILEGIALDYEHYVEKSRR
ncbi:hypothetical protein B0H14DRAFT_2352477, partial [Mycena olivaceomarginata]